MLKFPVTLWKNECDSRPLTHGQTFLKATTIAKRLPQYPKDPASLGYNCAMLAKGPIR